MDPSPRVRNNKRNPIGPAVDSDLTNPPYPAEANFRLFFDASPDATLVANRDGAIVLANVQAEKLFGRSREDLIGRSLETLISPVLRPGHSAHGQDIFADPLTKRTGVRSDLF